MDVHLRSALHPLLGRLRIGAPRLWPLSPKLHTSDCSFACPGSSTWVDKVPSRDTPLLDLAGRRGGVNLDDPQVARSLPLFLRKTSSKCHVSPGCGLRLRSLRANSRPKVRHHCRILLWLTTSPARRGSVSPDFPD